MLSDLSTRASYTDLFAIDSGQVESRVAKLFKLART